MGKLIAGAAGDSLRIGIHYLRVIVRIARIAVDTLLSKLFLEAMSHQVDTSAIKPCRSAKCRVTKREWQAIPEPFVLLTIDTDAFDAVGGMTFIRKKIAQLVKIAKAEESIQLDLVSELLLHELGKMAVMFDWKDEDGTLHSFDEPVVWPGKQELVESLLIDEACEEDRDINEDIRTTYESFYSLMLNGDEDVFWDFDFAFLAESDVVRGICRVYVTLEYDREWHMRPWLDIGAPVPEIVVSVLDTVERHAQEYGGMEEMRQALTTAAQKAMYDKEEEGEISRDAVERKESNMIPEDSISEIISDAEAIKVIIDDTVEDLSLKEQHRQQAIYVLAEHIIACAKSDSI